MRLVIAAFLCVGILTGSTCVDKATGTTKNADGTVTQNPVNAVSTVGSVVSSLPIPYAGLIGAGIMALPGIWLAIQRKNWKDAAIATATAGGKIVSGLPDSAAKATALKVFDTVHNAADIAEPLQQVLQQTVAAHAGVPS